MAGSVVVILLVLVQFSLLAAGEQCVTKYGSPCVAKCDNKTTLDISNLFKYPQNITSTNKYEEDWYYLWDPCNGYACPSYLGVEKCAVCQKSDSWYNCGMYVQPIWLINNRDPLEFSIEYPFGDTWRISVFSFREVPNQKTTVKYINENNLQYNFVVEGSCIGQPNCT